MAYRIRVTIECEDDSDEYGYFFPPDGGDASVTMTFWGIDDAERAASIRRFLVHTVEHCGFMSGTPVQKKGYEGSL